MNSKSLLLVGNLYARAVGTTGAFFPLLNGKAEISHSLDTQDVPNYGRSGGGKDQILSRVKEVKVELELWRWDKRNWALALGAPESAIVDAAPVVDETHVAYVDGMVRLNHVASAITGVKDASNAACAEGTDYKLVPGGLIPLEGGSIADGETIKVSYTKAAYINYQACTRLDAELECYYVGENENDGNKLVTADFWRMYVPPTEKIALMGDKLQSLKLKAELLADTTKGQGLSSFYSLRAQV